MIKELKNRILNFTRGSNRVILNNSMALMILQIANMVLPLISIPYLLNTLGPDNYGLVAFGIVTVSFLQIIVDYGFNLTGVRQISIANSKSEINKIYTSVLVCKLILAILCGLVGVFCFYTLPRFNKDFDVYVVLITILFSNVLLSNWVFQGMQKMKYITYINVIIRIAMVISIFLFVHNEDDYINYAIIYVCASILISLVGQMLIRFNLKIKFTRISFNKVILQLKDGKDVFASTILSSILSNAGIFVLGITNGNSAVAYFSASEKLLKAVRVLYSPIINAIFPETSKRFELSFSNGYQYVKKAIKYISIPLIICCIMVVLLSYKIFKILYEPGYWEYSNILAIGSIWVLLSILNNFYGIQMLVGSGNGDIYAKKFFVASLITIILFFILSVHFSAYGIIVAMILGELILTILLKIKIRKIKNSLIPENFN